MGTLCSEALDQFVSGNLLNSMRVDGPCYNNQATIEAKKVLMISVEMWNDLPVKTLNLHTNAHAVLDRPTLEDVNGRIFRSGSFHE